MGCRNNRLLEQWAVGIMGCQNNGSSELWAVGIMTRNRLGYTYVIFVIADNILTDSLIFARDKNESFQTKIIDGNFLNMSCLVYMSYARRQYVFGRRTSKRK